MAVAHWDGGETRDVEIYTETCLWYKSGFQPVLIRWVLVRDPQGEYDPQAFLSTHVDHTPLQILTWFVRRWRMELRFCKVSRTATLSGEFPSFGLYISLVKSNG